jgi:hypothetical protein
MGCIPQGKEAIFSVEQARQLFRKDLQRGLKVVRLEYEDGDLIQLFEEGRVQITFLFKLLQLDQRILAFMGDGGQPAKQDGRDEQGKSTDQVSSSPIN